MQQKDKRLKCESIYVTFIIKVIAGRGEVVKCIFVVIS